jgi:hypothetical protein
MNAEERLEKVRQILRELEKELDGLKRDLSTCLDCAHFEGGVCLKGYVSARKIPCQEFIARGATFP